MASSALPSIRRTSGGGQAWPARGLRVLLLGIVVCAAAPTAQVQPELRSLKTVAVPAPIGVDAYVRDFGLLVVLGKALFWDMQVGSDNHTACATCHFHAGADHRHQNQLASTPDTLRTAPLNRVLATSDFPFHLFEDQHNRASPIIRDTRLIVGSAGVPLRQFIDISRNGSADRATDPDGLSAPGILGLKVRQATTRNAPSVINAVFNVRNFQDGRASSTFTGRTPFGDSDTAMNGLRFVDGTLQPFGVRVENASLASQAMGPPLNHVEMSYAGRTWPKIGKKLLPLVALGTQAVASDDGVLGEFARADGPGLKPQFSYAVLVRAAFTPELWASSAIVDAEGRVLEGLTEARSADEFTQMEFNFPIFWGLAIQAYEATLVSDDTRFDRYADGDRSVLTDLERAGLEEFLGVDAKCTQCHGGPEFTAASFTNVAARGFDVSRPEAFGFFRIGVSPIPDDIGAGGTDGFGRSMFPAASHESTMGVFKTPGLRNVELTGPYLHTGGSATLDQVMAFYDRRGDFREGVNMDPTFLSVEIGSRSGERLAAFLKALTDDRVKYERAPFDHPALCVPTGHPEAAPGVLIPDRNAPGAPLASDRFALVPAVGQFGSQVPLQTFEELLLGIGNDGSRAHTMIEPCTTPDGSDGPPRSRLTSQVRR